MTDSTAAYRWAAVGAAALVVMGVARLTVHEPSVGFTARPATVTKTTGPSELSGPPSSAEQLAGLLPDSGPDATDVPVPTGVDGVGAIGLDAYAARSKDPVVGRRALVDQGFLGAYKRAWVNQGATRETIVYVVEFGTHRGAHDHIVNALFGIRVNGATAFAVSNVGDDAGGVELTVPTQSGSQQRQVRVLFSAGRRYFEVVTAVPAPAVPGRDETVTFAHTVAARAASGLP